MWGWLTPSQKKDSGGGGGNEWDPLEQEVGSSGSPFQVVVPSPAVQTPVRPTSIGVAFQTPVRQMPEVVDDEFCSYARLIDYKQLQHRLPEGMYVSPSSLASDRWNGVFFPREGPFVGGVFRFILHLSRYPSSCPKVVFTTRVFHPAVDVATGSFCLSPLFPQWSPQRHRVWHVLIALRDAFLKPISSAQQQHGHVASDEEGSGNADASRMVLQNASEFGLFAAQCAKESVATTKAVLQGTSDCGPGIEFGLVGEM